MAVIAHPWSLLGSAADDKAEIRRKYVRSCCAINVRYETYFTELIADLFVEAGFLVATYNSRGAGKSGGHGNASAQTEVEDYETVLTRIMSYAEEKHLAISNVYICVSSSFLFESDHQGYCTASLSETNGSAWLVHCISCPSISTTNKLYPHFTASHANFKIHYILHRFQ